jgi:hypothetical protein
MLKEFKEFIARANVLKAVWTRSSLKHGYSCRLNFISTSLQ